MTLHEVKRVLDMREAARAYVDAGYEIVPLVSGEKRPADRSWQRKVYGADDVRAQDNLGLRCSRDVDVDIDCLLALECADTFLPKTTREHGRLGKPRGHRWCLSEGLASEQFKDISQGYNEQVMLVEVRAGAGHQTVVPPSIWVNKKNPNHREFLSWHDGSLVGAPASSVDGKLLRSRVACIAAVALMARHWPRVGIRRELRLAYARVLLETLGLDTAMATRILEWTCRLGGSDENGIRHAARAIADTRNALDGQENAIGAATVAKLLPEGGDLVKRLRQWFGVAAANGIVIEGGKLTEIVDRSEAALLSTGHIYQRGGVLVRAIRLDRAIGDTGDVRREAGSTMLLAVHEPWLIEQMGQQLDWFRYNEAKDKHSPTDPPSIYARTLLSRGEWRFRVLRGILTAPTLARDGRIISEPGFDAGSGLLVDIAPGSFPSIPSTPSQDDARIALVRLLHPLRGFPFIDEAATSVALSALLTGLVRVTLRTAPLHGYDAPSAGTGKSMLAEMVGLLAMGYRPPALSQGKTDEEDEKRLSTVLFAGDPVIHIDNCERPISGDFLCSMLTQEVVQARILGLSERRVLPSTALVLASGNNLTLAGDTSRRAVICRLDANVERPDTRVFDFDCHAELLASRPELVVAGLTILRAYAVAGRPVKLTPMGSFNDWEWIRGALVWLDCADPADTREAILDSDPRKDELLTVIDLWEQALGITAVDVAEIARRADELNASHQVKELRDKLTEVACRGVWSGKSVGWWLRRHKDRIVGSRCLRSEQSRDKQRWWLEKRGEQDAIEF